MGGNPGSPLYGTPSNPPNRKQLKKMGIKGDYSNPMNPSATEPLVGTYQYGRKYGFTPNPVYGGPTRERKRWLKENDPDEYQRKYGPKVDPDGDKPLVSLGQKKFRNVFGFFTPRPQILGSGGQQAGGAVTGTGTTLGS